MMSQASNPIGVIGTGTMGAGIAQTATAAGWKVKLFDTNAESVTQAIQSVGKRFDRLVEKERITEDQATSCKANLIAVKDLEDLGMVCSSAEELCTNLSEDYWKQYYSDSFQSKLEVIRSSYIPISKNYLNEWIHFFGE